MKHIMCNVDIFVINDAIFFSVDGKTSILDDNKKLPIQLKNNAPIMDFVKDNGQSTYYTTSLPMACIDFFSLRNPESELGKKIISVYKKFKNKNFGLARYLNHCSETIISEKDLLSMYTDIANGFDRKKAIIRVANSLGTDDFSVIPKRAIELELNKIQRERAIKLAQCYQNFEDKEL